MKLLNVYISRIIVLCLMVTFFQVDLLAQNVNVPTASLSSGGKQANIPVNYNNGSANFAIPIHTIDDYDLNLPISISYQTGGVQVEEIASNIGLGWTLNTGGGIYRQVNGIPDDWNHAYENEEYIGYLRYISDSFDQEECENCIVDTQPDIFIFNVNGHSGKFFFNDQGEIIKVVKSDIKIEYETGLKGLIGQGMHSFIKWKITLPNGEIYFFGEGENDSSEWNVEIIKSDISINPLVNLPILNSWFLSEIKSLTNHKISFSYTSESYGFYRPSDVDVKFNSQCLTEGDILPFQKYNHIKVYSKRLVKIESHNTMIDFQAPNVRLDLTNEHFLSNPMGYNRPKGVEKIIIKKRYTQVWNVFNQFQLNLSYFKSNQDGLHHDPLENFYGNLFWPSNQFPDMKRLKLNSISSLGNGTESPLETTFNYHEEAQLPRQMSKSRDYWGFHNGHYENRWLLPKIKFASSCMESFDCTQSSHYFLADNMEPDFESTRLGALKSIDYPNGAFVKINYEPHDILTLDYDTQDYINTPVGGLRIQSLETNDNTRHFDYSKKYEGEKPRSTEFITLELCEECPNSPEGLIDPGGPITPCTNGAYDETFHHMIECDANLNLSFQLVNDYCTTEPMFVRFKWWNAEGIDGQITRSYPSNQNVQSENFTHSQLLSYGLIPGYSYNFSFESYSNDDVYFDASAKLIVSYPDPIITNQIKSSGKLVNYPSYLTLDKDRNNSWQSYFNDNCTDETIFKIQNINTTAINSLNGHHVLYGQVKESINNGEFGYSVYKYNTDSKFLKHDIIHNALNPIIPLFPRVPNINEMILEPEFGTLIKSSLYDKNDNVVQEMDYEYYSRTNYYNFIKWDRFTGCIPGSNESSEKSIFTRYKLKQFILLPSRTRTTVDGVTTIHETDYDLPDFNHMNPISRTTYCEINESDKRIARFKYAYELNKTDLLAANVVSIPLETLINGGLSGGTKTEFTTSPYILPQKHSIARDNGQWKLIKEITSWNSDGQPLSIWNKSTPLETTLEWENGLLKKSSYGTRNKTFTYDELRRLKSKTSKEGFTTYISEYDGFNRIKIKTEMNGKYRTSYDYFISPTEDEKLTTTVSYPLDNFGIPDQVSESYYDTYGRIVKNIRKSYTYTDGDFISVNIYDAIGRLILSKSPSVAGLTEHVYEASPLGRKIETTPAGSPKKILSFYGTNSSGQIPGYTSGALYKSTVIDENGNTHSSFKDVFGRVLGTIDPLGQKTINHFNSRDQLIKTIPPGASVSDMDKIYTYEYADDGLLLSKTIPGIENAYTYEYDSYDIPYKETMPNGSVVETVYHLDYKDFIEQIIVDGTIMQEFEPYHTDYSTAWISDSRTYIPETGEWLNNHYNLDSYGRIESENVDFYQGSATNTYVYDDMNNIRSSHTEHIGLNSENISFSRSTEYDKGLRVLENIGSYPGFPEMKINSFVYDEMDRTQFKIMGDGLQELSFGYNSRSWLKSINSVESTYPIPPPDCNDPTDQNPEPCKKNPVKRTLQITLAYDCDHLSTGTPTNVNIQMKEKNFNQTGHQYSSIISNKYPFNNGSSLLEIQYSDSTTVEFPFDDSALAEEWIQNVLEDCLGFSTSTLAQNEAILESITLGMSDGSGHSGPTGPPGNNDPQGKLFGLELHYIDGKADLQAPGQYNGNISWMEWRVNGEIEQQYGFQYDALNRLLEAKYKGEDALECEVLPEGAYDVSIGNYDPVGNIGTIKRQGVVENVDGAIEYGLIDDITMTYTANQISSATENAELEKGYQSGGSYNYDDYGNLISDSANGISLIEYNYLDLPTKIVSDDGVIEILYDGLGGKLKLTETNADGEEKIFIYQGNIQYLNGERNCIFFDEGRILYNQEILIGENLETKDFVEWSISDHLGNTRVRFTDKNGDGKIQVNNEDPGLTEVLGSSHYYPFGMQMEGLFTEEQGQFQPYQYNGIEHFDMIGHGISLATHRVHDAALGRWWQIDPEVESAKNHSTYNSMWNNPIIYSDPNGDFAMAGAAIFASYSIASGMINKNLGKNGNDPFQAALIGAQFGSALSAGYGGVISYFLSDYIPSYQTQVGDWSFGVSPAIAFGSNGYTIGVAGSVSYFDGNIGVGLSTGIGYGSHQLGANSVTGLHGNVGGGIRFSESGGGWHGGLYSNQTFGREIGQRVGGAHIGFKDSWNFIYENDGAPFARTGMNDRQDRFRTNAASISTMGIDLRLNMFTGDSFGKIDNNCADCLTAGHPIHGLKTGDGDMYRLGALSIGYNGYRIGMNNEEVRHFFQNKFAHTIVKGQGYFRHLGTPHLSYTERSTVRNPYSLWSY